MESGCRTGACALGPHCPRASVASCARALLPLLPLLLLLALLPRPAGCLATGEALGTQPTAALAHLDVPCSPRATCPSGGPRLPRQAPNTDSTPVSTARPFALPSCGVSSEQDPTLRDPEAMARRWPWMVSVRADGVHVCAGTLIASRWVLTVAHCVVQHGVNYTVRVGSPWIDQVTQTSSNVQVVQVIVNSRYRPQRYWSWVGRANNIGLLKLERTLKYSKYVWPVCLPDLEYTLEDGALCTVTGWGYPRTDGDLPQFQTIQEKEVTILNSRKCENFYRKSSRISALVRIINSQMICVSDTGRENFCYEVTGEPLVCLRQGTWYLAGLASWGPGCRRSEAPPIFLRVASYPLWLWDKLSRQSLAPRAPSSALLLALLPPLSLLAAW